MKIDVSEVKTYRECHRKHLYSSRNRYHLRPVAPNDNLVFGTQFHEVLAMTYLGTPKEKILEWIDREVTDSVHYKVMTTMFKGYYDGPYQKDKDRYVVIDIEKSFEYPIGIVDPGYGQDPAYYGPWDFKKDDNGKWIGVNSDGETAEALCVCGSIDMICIDVTTGELVGFEHKTTKNFRPEVYDLLDEQPRVYSWAMHKILDDYHAQGKYLEVTKVGPIYLNQVRKLQAKFDHQRVTCKYTVADLENFMSAFIYTCLDIADKKDTVEPPQPSYTKCQMCDYANLCMQYGYKYPELTEVLDEFDGEYQVREVDHLEEKAQRHVDDT